MFSPMPNPLAAKPNESEGPISKERISAVPSTPFRVDVALPRVNIPGAGGGAPHRSRRTVGCATPPNRKLARLFIAQLMASGGPIERGSTKAAAGTPPPSTEKAVPPLWVKRKQSAGTSHPPAILQPPPRQTWPAPPFADELNTGVLASVIIPDFTTCEVGSDIDRLVVDQASAGVMATMLPAIRQLSATADTDAAIEVMETASMLIPTSLAFLCRMIQYTLVSSAERNTWLSSWATAAFGVAMTPNCAAMMKKDPSLSQLASRIVLLLPEGHGSRLRRRLT